MASVYHVNKGINAAFEFKGLKAQYIVYLIVGAISLLGSFAILYACQVSLFLLLPATGITAGVLLSKLYKMSNKYGAHGLAKIQAHKQVPAFVGCRKRIRKILQK